VVERVLSHQDLLRDNERLRSAVRTLESCRTLMHCLDPGEVYAVALDLCCPRSTATRPRAVPAQRDAGLDGIAFRGFDEVAATELPAPRRAGEADSALFARASRTTRGGPIGEALEELGVAAGPRCSCRCTARRRKRAALGARAGPPDHRARLEHAR
jgi:hypothetical protein